MDMNFKDNGFMIFRNVLHGLDDFEQAVIDFYRMQARKLDPGASILELAAIFDLLEEEDPEALYQVQKFFPFCPRMRRILDNYSLFVPKDQIDLGSENLWLHDGPAIFINRPHTDRLLYRWHSEEHYYPKRRQFFNLWFPLFGDKTKENGTMSFKVGSHKRTYPFAEYQGYDKDSLGKSNHFIQYEIPENFLTDFQEYYCEIKRGDLVLFHSNLVHRSNPNSSENYSYAGVARIWNPQNDLTISGTLAATPYGKDIGRPDMWVKAW